MNFHFPELPKSKVYGEKTTPEQNTFFAYIHSYKLTKQEEKVFEECILFYNRVFGYLKSLDLTSFTDNDVKQVSEYLKNVFNIHYVVHNDITFKLIFRVTIIREGFLEDGKVRHPQYLYNPPVRVNRAIGVFNRCNSPNTTVFYAAFYENVAMRETKPKKGERIILTVWENITGEPFVSYTISNAFISNNVGNEKATAAFLKKMRNHHPLFVELCKINLQFLASEFVKDKEVISPKRTEYLYSAFFAEQCLSEPNPNDPSPKTDFIIYPSVAFQHFEDNICLTLRSIDKIRPIFLKEYEVTETYYDKPLTLLDPPLGLKLIRNSISITSDKIGWSDD